MHSRVIVLKLGGSVLESPDSLPKAVHEIYRWRREGYAVVAVVSAFAGETDRLLSQARNFGAQEASIAALAATGELQSAALLGAALDRAGIPVRVLHPAALAWTAEGSALEALPQQLDVVRLRAALHTSGVVVLPGFSGIDAGGACVLFGRGGSDLSALFVAQQLGARCRLLKDVVGLWESDPSRPLEPGQRAPRRYARASWANALATDGQILQHRALRWAQAHQFEFEVAALGSEEATLVGGTSTRWSTPRAAPQPLRMILLGLGTVGRGIWQQWSCLGEQVELVAVASRQRSRAAELGVPIERWYADPQQALRVDADVVIEVLGGLEPARSLIERALRSGRSVITANKQVLGQAGLELETLARLQGVALLGSACVGGSTPVLERVQARRTQICGLRGVLSGSVNSILELVSNQHSLAEALQLARDQGLTEIDASRDLEGRDAADKLRVLARILGKETLCVEREQLDEHVLSWARAARTCGHRVRQVSQLDLGQGKIRAQVQFQELAPGDPLFDLPGASNAVVLIGEEEPLEIVRGLGAGSWPTAQSVLGDLLTLQRQRHSAAPQVHPLAG